MRKMRFVVKQRPDKQYMFNIVSSNGKVMATSEGYHNHKDCLKTVESIIYHSLEAIIIDVNDIPKRKKFLGLF